MNTVAAPVHWIGIVLISLGLCVAACDETPAFEASVETLFAACDADRSPAFEAFAGSPSTISAEAVQRAVDQCDARVGEWLPPTATPVCVTAVDEYRALNRSMMRRLALVVAMRQQGVPVGTYGESGPEFLRQVEAVEQHVVSSCRLGRAAALPKPSVRPEAPAQESTRLARPTDGAITDIPKGSPDRSDIMDALRPTAEREYGEPVEFIVLELRRSRSVAFASVQPQRPGGEAIDCGSANCAPPGRIDAILQPDDGTWRVVDARVRANDEWRVGYCPQMPVGLIRECD